MIAAALTGYFDAGGHFPPPRPVRPHFYAAAGVILFYTARLGYWQWAKEETHLDRPFLIGGALVGNALVALAGFLGGRLVYS